MEASVKYIGVGSLENQKIIASYSSEKSFKDSLKKEIDNILLTDHEGEWATRSPSAYGVWYIQADYHGLVYLSLVKSGYSDRFAAGLLSELRSIFITQGPEHLKNSPSESYTRIMADDLKQLYSKYNNTFAIDKVAAVNQKVLEVKVLATEGINQVMRNVESAEILVAKTNELESSANMFKNDAKRLERIMYCRKMKITCILALVVIGVLLYIIVPIIINASD
ncbi:hypothetical protein SteCoe_15660 [Stentor coeruleus]|uniref:V-SNARE coiled-coil homology domain-containing protein n=1 Tax=Stentor coeruleus TaxID=5963 RepID=A0A1R2C328_9CILI|nr:hypothetical protein SteCoe_15660 [Stentor coeruleus]